MNAALPAAVRVVDLETTGSRPPEDGVVELGWQDVVEDGGAWRVGLRCASGRAAQRRPRKPGFMV